MADEGKLTLPRSLNLNTVVLIVGLGSGFYAQWEILQERSSNLSLEIAQLNSHLNATDERLENLRSDFIISRTHLEDLIDQLRRHASLDRGFKSPNEALAPAVAAPAVP